jgi:hypothetical protein
MESIITISTTVHHQSLSRVGWIQYIPSHPCSIISILILSSHLHLGHPGAIFSSGYQTEILYAFLISPMPAAYPAHLILLSLIILIFGKQYKWLFTKWGMKKFNYHLHKLFTNTNLFTAFLLIHFDRYVVSGPYLYYWTNIVHQL